MIFGREHELTALHTAYASMLAGHGSVLFLTGEAGLGKTTLVHAWAKQRDTQNKSDHQTTNHDAQPPTLFLESACSIPIGNVDVGRLEALQPWADVVAQLHEKLAAESSTTESNTTSEASTAAATNGNGKPQHKLDIRKLMRDAAPAWLWALPFVGEVAHAALVTARLVKDQRTGVVSQINSPAAPDPSSSPVANSSDANVVPATDNRQYAAANQEQVFQQYVNLLTKIAEATPLVIFLDDLHWADTSSCNLLFYLARQIAGKKILVIATYRQDDAARAEAGKGHAILTVKNEILRYSTGKELALSYLNREAIQEFLSNTFKADGAVGTVSTYVADKTFETWLHRISDGNSLFMTQFVKTLREDKHLDDSGRFVGDYDCVIIPTSALAVVEERTRRLDANTRKLLMYATAEGEEFTSYVLERLTKKEPMELLDELHIATTMGLIAQRGTGRLYANTTTGIFGFSHALFHKALYDSLLEMQKQHLHQQCFVLLKAEWDRLSDTKQRTTTLATKLLAHAGKCEEWSTVAKVALAAAKEFWKAYNEGEALAMIGRVLEASDEAEGLVVERAEAIILRGYIGVMRSRYDDAAADYGAAEALFRSVGIDQRAVDAVNEQAWTLIQTASYDTAFAEAERALHEAWANGYRKGESSALSHIGFIHWRRGAHDEALSFLERSVTISTDIGNRHVEAGALLNIGNVYADRGALTDALSYFERSLAIYTASGARRGEATAQNNIGAMHAARDARDEALPYYERSLAICIAIGNRQGEARALNNIGNLHSVLGAYDEALSYYERGLAIYAAIGKSENSAITHINIGCTLRMLGKIAEARGYVEQGIEMATKSDERVITAEATAELGLVAEAEARALVGADLVEKLAEARRLIGEALLMYRELKLVKEEDKWSKELERIKASA